MPGLADDSHVTMTTVLPIIATLLAAALGALGSTGWTADTRLLRRADQALDLAAKTPRRDLRVKLRAAAHADIEEALKRRGTLRQPLAVAGAAVGATLVAVWLIPWWVARHPEQLAGWLGLVWLVLLAVYGLGAILGWAVLAAMLAGRRSRRS